MTNLDFAFKFFEVNGVYPTSDELIMKYKEKTGEVVPPKPIEKEIIEQKKEVEYGVKNSTLEKKLSYLKWFFKKTYLCIVTPRASLS